VCSGLRPVHPPVHADALVPAGPQPAHVRGLQALPAALHAQHRRVRAQERRALCGRGRGRGHHDRRSGAGRGGGAADHVTGAVAGAGDLSGDPFGYVTGVLAVVVHASYLVLIQKSSLDSQHGPLTAQYAIASMASPVGVAGPPPREGGGGF
ncbi:unnamed protein product, partial [Tetraodon nigroviridis]